MANNSNTYSTKEVAKHNKEGDLWVTIQGNVYDLSSFADLHPGGTIPLLDYAGKDATEIFFGLHRNSVLQDSRYARLQIGVLAGAPAIESPVAAPYAESNNTWRIHSPYYNESHHRFRTAVREFMDREVTPYAAQLDEDGTGPTQELNMKMGQAGLLAIIGNAAHLLQNEGIELPGGIRFDEVDAFHELIMAEEFKRIGTYGFSDGLCAGIGIGLPPILKFANEQLLQRIVPDVVGGRKRICLAITEPYAGSDVSKVRTKAVLNAAGTHYVVTGVKKWITGGVYADFFTTLCQTDKGMTMIVIPRDDSVSTKKIKTSYSMAAGTAYVEFYNTVVGVENVVGQPGKGFSYTMANFNKERWLMIAGGNRLSRLMAEECFKWANQRVVFGQKLIQQPVIRNKLAEMIAGVEVVHSMLEDITYQMTKLTEKEQAKVLAGPVALLKFKQTRVATMISDNACQIFGGRALTRSGMGQFIEKFQRSFKMQAILGGSEEIMADLAIRQAVKGFDSSRARL
eukprot:m.52121 g.52121  ORF g.52121 m.52121 type:complete len:512 (-) comp21545_c0_seq1:133-1668(-)